MLKRESLIDALLNFFISFVKLIESNQLMLKRDLIDAVFNH